MNRSPLQITENQLTSSGKGEMHHFELFPGIECSHTQFFSKEIALEHEPLANVLEINHCRKGSIGWDMRDGMSVYLGPGDLDIHTMDCCAVSAMSLPLGYYEGITIAIDIERLERERIPFLSEAGIDMHALLRKLCPDRKPLALPASEEISHIFDPWYHVTDRLRVFHYKLKVLELILFLEELVPVKEKRLGRYYSGQADLIKEIHQLITDDLQQRYTIEELSRKYLVNTTTLKSVFKAVYGQPIGAYMKEYRIRRGMTLLRDTDKSIAEVALQVGYESQGNFTEAFKTLVHLSPSEYRSKHQNEKTTDRGIL